MTERNPTGTSRVGVKADLHKMINASLKELSAALAGKQLSSVELATLFLDRIGRLNPALNAFITVDPEKSLSMAREADARRARGQAQVLCDGVVVAAAGPRAPAPEPSGDPQQV